MGCDADSRALYCGVSAGPFAYAGVGQPKDPSRPIENKVQPEFEKDLLAEVPGNGVFTRFYASSLLAG
jgi:hypothetical protein